MAVTRINNNQITDANAGNAFVGINANTKLQAYSVTSGKLANNLTYGSDLTIAGNLTVQGNTTTIDTTIVTIEDPIISLAYNVTGSPVVDIGFIGERGTSNNIAFVWQESSQEFITAFTNDAIANTTINVLGYANFHTLNANVGGNLTVGGNIDITGNISNINVTGNITGGNLLTAGLVSATGNVTGANINTAGLITAGGNITGANLLTGGLISATSTITSAANITGGNVLTGGLISATSTITSAANITGGNVLTGGLISATSNITGGNILTAGVVSATGNVQGAFILGNGFYLTGVANSETANRLVNGTSNVDIPVANGNVTFGVGGTSNVVVVATSGQYITGVNSVSGNITGGNLLTGGLISATANVTGGNVLTGGAVSAVANVTGGNLLTGGLISATSTITSAANITGGNILTGGLVSATSNVTGGNLLTGGAVSSGGNVTGANVFTGGEVSAVGALYGGNVITAGYVSATGNIIGNYIYGNGSQLTGLSADTAKQIANGTSNVDIATANGNITTGVAGTANVIVVASTGQYITGVNSVSGNITGGNLLTGGAVSATANITGGNVLTGGQASASGNVTGGNLLTAGAVTATGDITTAGNLSLSGNIIDSGALTITTGSGNLNLEPAGNIVLGNRYINGLQLTPQQDADAASKYYVDQLVTTSISYHDAVVVATTGNLAAATGGTITYNQPNGAANGVGATLTTTGSFNLIDSANVQTVGTRILVKDQANAVQNGVYVWSNATVITRASTEDTYGAASANALSINDYFFVQSGNVNLGSAWIVDAPAGVITFGTSNILFAQFSQSQVYSANTSAGLSLVGQTFSAKIDNNTTAFDLNGNISVKASANLTTPNIGAATGTSLSTTGNIQGGNLLTNGLISATSTITSAANVIGGNITTAGLITATGNVTGGNIDTAGLITATGNITGGNLLTSGNISATGDINVANVKASVYVSATANIIGGNITTVGIVTATGNVIGGNVNTAGLITATGNITGGNLLTGGLISATSTITSAANITGANLLTGGEVSATANVTGGNILTSGLISATSTITSAANITGGNVLTGGLISATSTITSAANITGGNLLTGGLISATSNITGGNLLFGAGIVSGTGNVYASNFIGNISGNIDAGGANTEIQFNDDNVLAGSPGFTFNKTGNVVTANGNITGANLFTGGTVSATSNITGGNLLTAGLISATSTITSAANITGGNVLTGGLISATSTITSAANVIGGNITTAGLVTATGNVTGGNVLTGGLITATGNILGGNLILAGAALDTTAGRLTVNSTSADADFAVNGDTVANVFYVDAGTGTASFGSATQTTNAVVAFNATNSVLMPVGNTAQRPSTGITGMVRFNTTNNNLELYDNSAWTAVGVPEFTVIADQQFNGDGSTVAFSLSTEQTTNSCIVSINGVVQVPTVAYSVSGTGTSTLTFTEAPQTGDLIDVRQITTTTSVRSISNTSGNAVVEVLDTEDTVQITGNLLPVTANTKSIGSASKPWKSLYVAGNTIYLGSLQLKQLDASTFAVYKADGITQANIDVGNVDVSSIVSGTSIIGIYGTGQTHVDVNGNANVLLVSNTSALVNGAFSATGNITGSYILGNGSQLTGIDATSIQSGTSNVKVVSSGGNVTTSIGGTSNVIVVATTGQFVTGVSSVSGNVTGGNILTGGLISATSTITSAANITGGNVLTGGLISATANVTGGNVLTGGLISATSTITSSANITGGNVLTGGLISATSTITSAANITGGNVLTGGLISATGNISGGNLNITGNIVDTGELSIITGSNGNIALAPNGTGIVTASGAFSAVGNITGGNLSVGTGTVTVGNIVNSNGNGVGNIGSSSLYFNTVFAKATSAQYADLAEKYVSDEIYEPGTVVSFGGDCEVTLTTTDGDHRVAGVISTNPSYIMNAAIDGIFIATVALTGRVPCKVTGTVRKGDLMVSAGNGVARAETDPRVGTVIGKALADHDGAEGIIEVVVGRF